MSERKTRPVDTDVEGFLATVPDDRQRADSLEMLSLMADITGHDGRMWGTSIVGFGESSYRTADGKEHEWFEVGFSPRKQSLTLYIMDGFDTYEQLLGRLGKHTTGKACLYVKRLSDVDADVLRELIEESVLSVRASRT